MAGHISSNSIKIKKNQLTLLNGVRILDVKIQNSIFNLIMSLFRLQKHEKGFC